MEQNRSTITQTRATTFDVGLQKYMQRVYNVMAAGLVLTGFVAYVTFQTPALFQAINGTFLGIIVALAPLGIIFFGLTPRKVAVMSTATVSALYFALTGLIGLSMSYIFAMYSSDSIARVFFITSGMFAATSIYGYTTKRDLTAMGGFLMMGVIGLIIAMVVNIFLQSTMMQFVISAVGVLLFTALTAWDTQRIKETYNSAHGSETLTKMATMGALSLYLDFINLFQFLLQLLGNRN